MWKLDRWGRSLPDCIRSVQELVSAGVRFIASTQNIDTDESNPMSRFLLHILAAFGELEREMIRERVVSGIRTARANGKALGRPRRVFRRDEAVRLRAQGMSWRKIAQALDLTNVYGHLCLFRKPSARVGGRGATNTPDTLPKRAVPKTIDFRTGTVSLPGVRAA